VPPSISNEKNITSPKLLSATFIRSREIIHP
jgi:hypothetical protein